MLPHLYNPVMVDKQLVPFKEACNNFFTSYKLACRLLERDITMVATVPKNKPELPPALLVTKGREEHTPHRTRSQ